MQPLSKARPEVKSPKVSLFKGKESIGDPLGFSPFRGSLENSGPIKQKAIKSRNGSSIHYHMHYSVPLPEAIRALASDRDLI